jgi:hypothetical protein
VPRSFQAGGHHGNTTGRDDNMLEIALRIGWFLMGWGAAFTVLMMAYIGCQLYLGSRR